MKRTAVWLALASMSLSPLALPAPALAATTAEAKKYCAEQWEAEKKSDTIPRGMTKEKYMRQCTANYAANHSEVTPPAATETPPASAAATWPAPPTTPGSN